MKRRRVGTFTIDCEVASIRNQGRTVVVPRALVDSGSEYTWIPEPVLRELGVRVEKKDLEFQMANGQTITRSVGFAFLRAGGFFTVDEVVFGQPGDLALLGARTLEGFGARVDPRSKRLVASGPHPAARCASPRFSSIAGSAAPGAPGSPAVARRDRRSRRTPSRSPIPAL